MAGSTQYSAAAAKIRTRAGAGLDAADFEALAKFKTVNEIARYLKNETVYGEILAEIDDRLVHRGQLETVIRKSIFVDLKALSPYIPKESEGLIGMMLRKAEIEQIINCIYYLNNGRAREYILSVPTYLFEISRLDYQAMGEAKTYAELTEVLRQTPYYRVLRAYNPDREKLAGEFETAMYTQYYGKMFEDIDRLSPEDRRRCREMLGSQIDFLNIVTVLRVKQRFDFSPEETEKLLLPFTNKLGKALLHKMVCCSNVDEVNILLANSRYKNYFAGRGDVGADNFYFDYAYSISRSALAYGRPSLNTVVAYINLKNIEIRNLIRIIECVRYNLSYGEIVAQIIGYGQMKRRSESGEL